MTVSFIEALKDMQDNGAEYKVGFIFYKIKDDILFYRSNISEGWTESDHKFKDLNKVWWTKLTPKKKITFHEAVIEYGEEKYEVVWVIKDNHRYVECKIKFTGQTRDVEVGE